MSFKSTHVFSIEFKNKNEEQTRNGLTWAWCHMLVTLRYIFGQVQHIHPYANFDVQIKTKLSYDDTVLQIVVFNSTEYNNQLSEQTDYYI